MLSTNVIVANMELAYRITIWDEKPCAYIDLDPPQYFTKEELGIVLRDMRDENPDLYTQLVHIYILLDKGVPYEHKYQNTP